MHDWSRSRIGSNRPGATRQDAQMEVRDMGMSTVQFLPAADETGYRTPRLVKPSGVHQAHGRERGCGVGLSTT
jgi:hypothetical protein